MSTLKPLKLLITSEPIKFRQILDELIHNNRKDCGTLNTFLEARATDKMSELAHRITGAARVVKAELLVECCQRLEVVCLDPQATFGQLEEAVREIEAAIYKLEQALLSLHKF